LLLWELFVAFGRANLLGYGGGPSVVPLIRAEVVDTYHWMTAEEFANALAIGNLLPGPIATKMSGYIGYKVAGIPGAIVATLATVLPTAILMVLLAAILLRYRDSAIVRGMIAGAKPVVWVLFLLLVVDFFPFVRPDKAGWIPAAIAACAFIGVYFFKIHEGVAIVTGLLLGALFLR